MRNDENHLQQCDVSKHQSVRPRTFFRRISDITQRERREVHRVVFTKLQYLLLQAHVCDF
jgi:hypothetical protein